MLDEPPNDARDDEPAEGASTSPAWRRFHSCRWHRAAEEGVAAHCSHRDVLPMTGQHGFDAESWCGECSLYKLRRAPRRLNPT